MRKGKQLALMALAASAFLGSCKKTHEQDIIAQDEVDYDTPLRTLLEEMGGADGLNYFVLPESDDYASIPQDPLNPITSYKVEPGKLLFHETGIATNPKLETRALVHTAVPAVTMLKVDPSQPPTRRR